MKRTISDHFDGRVFHNTERTDHGLLPYLKWVKERRMSKWPRYERLSTGPKPPDAVHDGLRVTFINQATTLIQVDGINILTDPIWTMRCSPIPGVGPKRARNPGIDFDDLPPIHLVLVSHNHYDHLDSIAVRQLAKIHRPLFITGIGNERTFKKLGASNAVFLDWWQSTENANLPRVTFTPARHFSGRSLFDQNRSLWGAFVVETSVGPVYFAGDTGYGPHFKEVASRLGPPRVALLPIGAYRPRWFMSPVHMDPDDAVRAHLDLGAQWSMGIHFGTFRLTEEGIDEPKADLAAALKRHGINNSEFWVPNFGGSRFFPAHAACTSTPQSDFGSQSATDVDPR